MLRGDGTADGTRGRGGRLLVCASSTTRRIPITTTPLRIDTSFALLPLSLQLAIITQSGLPAAQVVAHVARIQARAVPGLETRRTDTLVGPIGKSVAFPGVTGVAGARINAIYSVKDRRRRAMTVILFFGARHSNYEALCSGRHTRAAHGRVARHTWVDARSCLHVEERR